LNFLFKKKNLFRQNIYFCYFILFFFIVIRNKRGADPLADPCCALFFFLTFTVLFCVCVLLCGLSALYIARACATPSIPLALFFFIIIILLFFPTRVTQQEGTREIYNFFSHLHRHTIITAAVSSRVRLRYAD